MVSKFSNIAIFAPITNSKRSYPFYITLSDTLKTTGVVMLDQLVTIDYETRGYDFIETVDNDFVEKLLNVTKTIFQRG